MNCPNCNLPRFTGPAGYVGPQCMCALAVYPNPNTGTIVKGAAGYVQMTVDDFAKIRKEHWPRMPISNEAFSIIERAVLERIGLASAPSPAQTGEKP